MGPAKQFEFLPDLLLIEIDPNLMLREYNTNHFIRGVVDLNRIVLPAASLLNKWWKVANNISMDTDLLTEYQSETSSGPLHA